MAAEGNQVGYWEEGEDRLRSLVFSGELNQLGVTWLSYQSCELNSCGNWKETKDGVGRAVNQLYCIWFAPLLYLVLSHTTVPERPERRWDPHLSPVHVYYCSTICSIPLFDPSLRLLVCLTNPFTHSYIVAMELFQRILVTF
jgi:hypothetical protein